MMNEIAEYLRTHDHLVVTSHSRPDGDALGSSLAVAQGLEQLGKSVRVVSADPPPSNYADLPGVEALAVTGQLDPGDSQAVIVLECNNLVRTGVSGLADLTVINIDHHPGNEEFGRYNWLDPTAAAVGEMVYLLLLDLGVQITKEIATNLYVAVLTDTGSFQFSNTTAETFRIAGELVAAGVEPGQVSQSVYFSQPLARLRLLGEILETLEVHPSGRIAWIHLRQSALQRTGAASSDTEGLVNYPLSVGGVEVCAFFREEPGGGYRVSLRSKNEHDVGAVASLFGGGGHRNAAGLSVGGDFAEARRKVVGSLENLFEA